MKYITSILFFCSLQMVSSFAQTTKQVLFVGNSYTYVNDLPKMTSQVASSTGDSLIYDSSTPGGYSFQAHSTNTTTLSKIALGRWDNVVLQEQSQIPSFPETQVQADCYPFAKKLDSLILLANPCTETMFYMTWGRKNGDASNCTNFPPLCTYAGMDSLLYLRYMTMAVDNHAVISPVGAVWNYIRNHNPSIELYSADESHPSISGTYAAACCFYTVLFKKNPLNISFNASLTSLQADSIKQAVKTVVYDSLLKWHIGEYLPKADFSFSASTYDVLFDNLSMNATSYKWYFGDGDTSTANVNTAHHYMQDGSFTVRLIATNCGESDTIDKQIQIHLSAVKEEAENNSFNIYPNPANQMLIIQPADSSITQIEMTDLYGKKLSITFNRLTNSFVANIHELPTGTYLIKIHNQEKTFTRKWVKN